LIGFSLEALIILSSIIVDGLSLEALHTTTRFSGRLSLLAFSAILLFRNKEGAAKWISDKPVLVVCSSSWYSLNRVACLCEYLRSQTYSNSMLGGVVAYAMIFAMPFLAQRKNDGRMTGNKYDEWN